MASWEKILMKKATLVWTSFQIWKPGHFWGLLVSNHSFIINCQYRNTWYFSFHTSVANWKFLKTYFLIKLSIFKFCDLFFIKSFALFCSRQYALKIKSVYSAPLIFEMHSSRGFILFVWLVGFFGFTEDSNYESW